jgi:hypothetical protein
MTKRAFDKIAAGLEDAIAYTRGDKTHGRAATIDVKSAGVGHSNEAMGDQLADTSSP